MTAWYSDAPQARADREGSAWPRPRSRRRAVVIAAGVTIHVAWLFALLDARLDVAVPAQPGTVWTNVLPVPRRMPSTPSAIHAVLPRAVFAPTPRVPMPPAPPAAALIAAAPASAASAPLPAESSAAPLRLTLTPGQLRALEADTPRTLAQRLAPPPAAPLLAQRLAPTPQFEEDDRNGLHTVRSHGGCFILVPSGQAIADPFNHGGERVSGRATNDNC